MFKLKYEKWHPVEYKLTCLFVGQLIKIKVIF